MQPERWVQIEELCQAALDRAEAQRALFLDAACAGDKALREEVESLLEYQETAKSFIETPALEVAAKMAAADQSWPLVGHQINHYRILALLGAGGMGKVYLAEDMTLRRRVALKLLPAEFTRNPDRVLRFKQEARAISALNHPNIITIYEIGEVAGTHYIATEFIDGQTLRQRLISETMPIGDVVDVTAQVAGALVAAHDSGVVHRDIKPENIMVRKDGLVKVLDFGLAKLTEFQMDGIDSRTVTNDPVNTRAGALMGTVRYMSPEQARGTMLGARSDLFSLGVVLHEMLAGKSPFAGATTAEIIAAILGQEPPATFSCRPEAPEALGRIVMQALRKDIAERYQTAQQMCTDLKELKQQLEIEAAYGKTHAAPTPSWKKQISRQWRPAEARNLWVRLSLGFAVCVIIAGLAAWYARPRSLQPLVWQSVPLTTYPGAERNPALSPDGNTVAFTWNGPAQDNFDIYIQPIASGRPQRLTTDPTEDSSPAWSPDGRTIAFLRRLDGERNLLILIPAAGGPEHALAETRRQIVVGDTDSTIRRSIAWTPDGLWITAPHQESVESTGLFLFSALTGSKRRLTQPTAGFDEHPAFSPDGATLAFARRPGPGGSDLYLQSLSKDFTSRDQVKRLTTTSRATHPIWTDDGQHIVYVDGANRGPLGPLRIIAISTSGSEQVPVVEGQMGEISLGRHLIYSQVASDTNVWRAEIRSFDASPAVPQLLISSTWGDNFARYSPNGKEIAFLSNRSGKETQIWIASADGSNPAQLTSMDGRVYFPNWSPNGQRIVFHARVGQGSADLFSIPAAGGVPKRLTTDPAEDVFANYSQNGQWIYFTSTRSGEREIWKIPADGGEATRLTDGGATMPFESQDGKALFYAQLNAEKGIWKIPVEGGNAVQVTGPIAKDPAFAVGRDGIYYVSPRESPTRQFIHFLSFSTGKSRPVVVSEREIGMGLSLSPDGHFLIFTQRDQVGSDLMLIQNFAAPR